MSNNNLKTERALLSESTALNQSQRRNDTHTINNTGSGSMQRSISARTDEPKISTIQSPKESESRGINLKPTGIFDADDQSLAILKESSGTKLMDTTQTPMLGIKKSTAGTNFQRNQTTYRGDNLKLWLGDSSASYEGGVLPSRIPHGSGQLQISKDVTYSGQWEKGCLEIETQSSVKHQAVVIDTNSLYIGEVKDGKPHGQGEMYEKNKNYYKGSFMNGLRHGNGEYSIKLQDKSKKNLKNLNARSAQSQGKDRIRIGGPWIFGKFQTIVRSEDRLHLAKLQEDIDSGLIVPCDDSIYVEQVKFIRNHEGKQLYTIVKTLNENVKPYNLKQQQLENVREKFNQPLSQCSGAGQKTIKFSMNDDKCIKCSKPMPDGHIAYSCIDCEICDSKIVCTSCQDLQDAYLIARMKNLESYFYRDHEIVMDGKTPKFKKVDDEELNESRELMTHQISICSTDDNGLVQLHRILVVNPFVLDLKIGRGQEAMDDYLFQNEVLFFDQEKEHVFWFTQDLKKRLILNKVTLQFNGEPWQKEPEKELMKFDVDEALNFALGHKNLNGQRCKLAQWPQISGKIITINGLIPKKPINQEIEESEDEEENQSQQSGEGQQFAYSDYLSDSKVFSLSEDEDWEICYRNVSLLLKVDQIDERIVIYTMHSHDEKTYLVMDTFSKNKPQSVSASKFKAKVATLELDDIYHINSEVIQVQDSGFQLDLYRSITQQMFNGTPIVFTEDFQNTKGTAKGKGFDEKSQTFTIICRRWGCFTFKYQKGQEMLQNANHMGKREVTSGYLGQQHYYAQVKLVESRKKDPIRNSNLLFQLDLYDIAYAQKEQSSHSILTNCKTYFFLLPSDVIIEKETDNLLFSKLFGLERQDNSDTRLSLMIVYRNYESGKKLKTCFSFAYQSQEGAMDDLPKKIQAADYIQYPIYARSAFNNSFIDFCNLARDLSQIRLNISPYRFVAFAHSNIQKNLRSGNFDRINTYIYFMAEIENEDKCSLLRITIRPWESERRWYEVASSWKITSIRDNLQIKEEELELIQQAVVLQTGRQKYLSPDFLIWKEMQSSEPSKVKTQRISEKSTDTGNTDVLEIFTNHPFVIGPFSQLYLIDSQDESRVLCINKNSDNTLNITAVFTHQSTILALQSLETDDIYWEDEDQAKHQRLALVDKDYNLQILGQKSQKQEITIVKLVNIGQSVNLSINKDFKSFLDNKKIDKQFLLTEKTIYFQNLNQNLSPGVELHCQSNLIEPITPTQKLTTIKGTINQCSSIQIAQWSQRLFAKMFEGNFKYTFITKSSLTKQLNLFSLKEQRMRIDYEDQTFSALEYHVLNSCILVTFERHVLIFNRLTHMMEEHLSCRSNIRVKIVESYNQHKQTAFIWGGDGDLYIYQNGLNQLYEPKLNPFTQVREAAQEFNDIILDKQSDLVKINGQNDRVICFTLKSTEGSRMQKSKLKISAKLTRPSTSKAYDYVDEILVELKNSYINEKFQVNFLMTRDFLVIKYKPKTLKAENELNQTDQDDANYLENDQEQVIFAKIQIEKDSNLKPTQSTFNKNNEFHTVPLANWLDSDQFKNGIRIDYVKPSGNTQVGDKENVIQISTPRHMILFDLEKQAEVDRILNYNRMTKFTSHFVDSGFTYYDIDKTRVKYFSSGAQFVEIDNLEKKERIISYSTEFQRMNCSLDRKNFVRPTIIGHQLGGCFKLFSRYNLIEIDNFLQLDQKKKYSQSDKLALLDRVDGQFIPSLFVREKKLLKMVIDIIKSKDDEKEQEIKNKLFLQRLMHTLIQGNLDTFDDYEWNQNTLNHALRKTKVDKNYEKAFPYLIEIFDTASSVNNSYLASYLSMEFSDLKLVFQPGQNQSVKEFVARGSIKPFMKLKDTLIEWDYSQHKKMILFGSKSTLLSLQTIKEKIQTPKKRGIFSNPFRFNTSLKSFIDNKLGKESQQVESMLKKQNTRFLNIQIDIFDIQWLNKNVPEFYQYLAKTKIDSFYDNLMIHSILSKSDYRLQIMPKLVLYLLQLIFVLIHNFYLIQSGYQEGWEYLLTIITVILVLIQARQEAQLAYWKGLRWKLVARSITVIINLFCISAGIFMTKEAQENPQYMFITVILPSFSSVSLVAQAIYWMQLIDKTALHLDIIMQSFKDIVQFMFIYVIYLFMGTAAFSVINHNIQIYSSNDVTESNEEGLIFERFGNPIVDTFVSQWLIGLGSDELLHTISEIDSGSLGLAKKFLYLYFMLGTLISTIVMINTLIAILSDSFSQVMERQAHSHHAIKARTEMYADFMQGIRLQTGKNKFTKEPYIYVIYPIEDDDQDQEWEGAVSLSIKQNNKTKKKLQELIEQNQKSNTVVQEKLNLKVDELKDQITMTQQGQSQINDKLDKLLEKFDKKQD